MTDRDEKMEQARVAGMLAVTMAICGDPVPSTHEHSVDMAATFCGLFITSVIIAQPSTNLREIVDELVAGWITDNEAMLSELAETMRDVDGIFEDPQEGPVDG